MLPPSDTIKLPVKQGVKKMILRRTKWICFLALGILLLDIGIALPAKTQDYPTQTLKIIVPFVAGGGVDVVARIVAPKLSKELGQSVSSKIAEVRAAR
jgi:tripartite-type tricarboxylate transporter receptor subunit TctC